MGGLKAVWDSAWLTNFGEQHAKLETALRERLKVRSLYLLNNGTTGLLVACRALGLRGEVITTPFTFPATAHAIEWSGLKPVFCDIQPDTLNIDPERVRERITPQTSGILAVHVYGMPCADGALSAIAGKHGIRVVYDAAHAFGVCVDGRGVGEMGDVTMFSFHSTKLFHTAEGGALATSDLGIGENIERLRNFGLSGDGSVPGTGINGKLSELHAVLGLLMLPIVNREISARRVLFDTYRDHLNGIPGVKIHSPFNQNSHNYQYCVVRVTEEEFGMSRDRLQEELKRFNVFSRRYFYPLCSDFPAYRGRFGGDPGEYPVARAATREVLALPLYGGLEKEVVVRICEMITHVRPSKA